MIFPFTRMDNSMPEGYFLTNIESVCKDVECTFRIMKKRWQILNNGVYHCDIVTCKKIFVTCCCLNKFMLDLVERMTVRVGRGGRISKDGIWLLGQTDVEPKVTD